MQLWINMNTLQSGIEGGGNRQGGGKNSEVNKQGGCNKWGVGKIVCLQLCLVVICSICFLHNWVSDVETGS